MKNISFPRVGGWLATSYVEMDRSRWPGRFFFFFFKNPPRVFVRRWRGAFLIQHTVVVFFLFFFYSTFMKTKEPLMYRIYTLNDVAPRSLNNKPMMMVTFRTPFDRSEKGKKNIFLLLLLFLECPIGILLFFSKKLNDMSFWTIASLFPSFYNYRTPVPPRIHTNTKTKHKNQDPFSFNPPPIFYGKGSLSSSFIQNSKEGTKNNRETNLVEFVIKK